MKFLGQFKLANSNQLMKYLKKLIEIDITQILDLYMNGQGI